MGPKTRRSKRQSSAKATETEKAILGEKQKDDGPAKDESLQSKVRSLEVEVLADHIGNANNLVHIHNFLTEAHERSDQQMAVLCVLSLHKLFRHYMTQTQTMQSDGHKQPADATLPEAESVFRRWLRERYLSFCQLCASLSRAAEEASVQVQILQVLMSLIECEVQCGYAAAPLQQGTLPIVIRDVLLRNVHLSKSAFELFCKMFLNRYADVRLFSLRHVQTLLLSSAPNSLLVNDADTADSSGADAECGAADGASAASPADLDVLLCNAYDLLCQCVLDDDALDGAELLVPQDGNSSTADADKSKKRKRSAMKASASASDAKAQRKALELAWLSLFRNRMPLHLYKKVLLRMDELIDSMKRPLRLCAFLTDSVEKGGLIAVLALDGLFVLITKHGLEYPDFYKALYGMLSLQLFSAKFRARFFRLLGMCLKSTHMPAYLVAAFAKRLARLALFAPPSGAATALAVIHNLHIRHQTIESLLHKKDLQEADTSSGKAKQTELDSDPFDADEPDPAKCNALQSSLWELSALRKHYCPTVAILTKAFDQPLSKHPQETDLEEQINLTYRVLFKREVKRHSNPVEYTPPSSLLNDGSFGGWNFQFEV